MKFKKLESEPKTNTPVSVEPNEAILAGYFKRVFAELAIPQSWTNAGYVRPSSL